MHLLLPISRRADLQLRMGKYLSFKTENLKGSCMAIEHLGNLDHPEISYYDERRKLLLTKYFTLKRGLPKFRKTLCLDKRIYMYL